MNALYSDLLDEGIDNVKIIAIGKGQYSADNSNWTDDNTIPVVNDPLPNDTWTNWDASQWDLFFLDSNGNYVVDFNINTWDYDAIYNTILGLLASGCTDPVACNYNETATDPGECTYPETYYNCDGTCILDGDENAGTCDGNVLSLFNELIPENFSIYNIYPNPFNPVTNIIYGLPEHINVQIIVYDLSGKQVETLINQFQTPGYHSVYWDADNLPSGVYLIRMDSGDFTQTQKVVLVK